MSKQMTLTAAVDFRPSFLRAAMNQTALRRARNKIYRVTLTELQRLSDRELADLGLCRPMLRSAAWEAALSAV